MQPCLSASRRSRVHHRQFGTARSNSFCAARTAAGALGAVASAPIADAIAGFSVNIGPPTMMPIASFCDSLRISTMIDFSASNWRSDPAVKPITANQLSTYDVYYIIPHCPNTQHRHASLQQTIIFRSSRHRTNAGYPASLPSARGVSFRVPVRHKSH